MWVKVVRELRVSAERAYAAFCALEELPSWVPGVLSCSVQSRHPDGSPDEVEFSGTGADGKRSSYSLGYSFDAEQHRLAWQPRRAAARGLCGYARFEALGPARTRLTYAVDHGAAWSGDRDTQERLAAEVVEAFCRYLGRDPAAGDLAAGTQPRPRVAGSR